MTFKKIVDFKRRDELVQEHLRLKDELNFVVKQWYCEYAFGHG